MLVVKEDSIPNKKIVKVVKEIKVRFFSKVPNFENIEIAKTRLVQKASALKADSIINFKWKGGELVGRFITYSGLAVITEYIIPMKQLLSNTVCWSCGTPIEKDQRYCRECFAKLT
jgi:uncharacterized protein YbjQ (UPF0145 family)